MHCNCKTDSADIVCTICLIITGILQNRPTQFLEYAGKLTFLTSGTALLFIERVNPETVGKWCDGYPVVFPELVYDVGQKFERFNVKGRVAAMSFHTECGGYLYRVYRFIMLNEP